jgi:hypothetical protein
MTGVTRIVVACLAASTAVAAQEPRFEVESLKRNTSGSTSTTMDNRPDGGLVMINGTLRNLIFNAYRPQNATELEGAPEWLRDRYDLIAKGAGAATTTEQRSAMLRALLADRLRLLAHYERCPDALHRDAGAAGTEARAVTRTAADAGDRSRRAPQRGLDVPWNLTAYEPSLGGGSTGGFSVHGAKYKHSIGITPKSRR